MNHVTKNYFKLIDFITTEKSLPNYPTCPIHLDNLSFLWRYLNYLREKLGKPIFINSAFRTPSVNKAVGGKSRSYHLQGRAADIRTIPSAMPELLSILNEQKGKTIVELIDHKTYFHISI